MFKLRAQNIAFWLAAPTLYSRYVYNDDVEARIRDLWRVHKYRESQGLGGTYNSKGNYSSDVHNQDRAFQNNMAIHISLDTIIAGRRRDPSVDNAFTRTNEQLDEYGAFHDDWSDIEMFQTSEYERFKQFKPKKEHVVGEAMVVPFKDDDSKFKYYNLQGESLYTNPPDSNKMTIDHGIEEDEIWNFRRTPYNQNAVTNHYGNNLWKAVQDKHAPWWGRKLIAPVWFKDEKFQKMLKQWEWKLELEQIKFRQALEFNPNSKEQGKAHASEIEDFLEEVKSRQLQDELKDVFVTDHKVKEPKYTTMNSEEDELFFKYAQSVKDYNRKAPTADTRVSQFESGRFEKGSLAQRLFEPLAGAKRLDNGARFYRLEKKELSKDTFDEDKLRAQFERANSQEALEFGEEEEDELRVALLDDLAAESQTVEEMNAYLDQELAIFKSGEKYEYVKDMKNAHAEGLRTSTANKILKTIPDHAFWDIKKPYRDALVSTVTNPWNPARRYQHDSFFDQRDYELWLDAKGRNANINENISKYRRY